MNYYTNIPIPKNNNANQPLFSFITKIMLFLLFMASLNFVNRFYYFVFAAFAVFIFFKSQKSRVNFGFVTLFCFSISLMAFWETAHSSVLSMIKCFTFPMCYFIGYNLFSDSEDKAISQEKVRNVCIILSFGPFLHLFLNLLTNIEGDTGRSVTDIWTKSFLSATGQAALGCMMVGVSLALIFSRYDVKYKLLAVLSLTVVFYYNLILAGRSLFLMAFIVAVIAFLNYIRNSSSPTQFIKVVIWTTLAIAAFLVMYNSNTFGIKETVENSNFFNRFFGSNSYMEVTDDPRLEIKIEYLKYLTVHPFGGGKIHQAVGSYAHDLYLDTYDEAGVFAFIFIAIVSVSSILKLFKVLKNKSVKFETKQLLLCLYTAIHLEFWIEPILAGMPWLLAIFCVINGMVSRLSESEVADERVFLR